MRPPSPRRGEAHAPASLRGCLARFALSLSLALAGFFGLSVPFLGRPPGECGRDVVVVAFTITVHLLSEHTLRRFDRARAQVRRPAAPDGP